MALPTSGPLSLSQIAAEFNIPAPYSMSKMYGKAAGIPTSGAISISQFYGKTNIFYVNISASTIRPNIRALALNAGWDGNSPVVVNITAPLINTLDLGTVAFPGGITINVSASTRIGSSVTYSTDPDDMRYSRADTAFITRVPVVINNQGIISGAGGAGGSGGSTWVTYRTSSTYVWGYGGGGGSGQGFANRDSLTVVARSQGGSGSYDSYSGATLGGEQRPWAEGGSGGNGGLWGESGGFGGGATYGGAYSGTGGGGGGTPGVLAGYAIDGRSFVQFINQGTIQGPTVR